MRKANKNRVEIIQKKNREKMIKNVSKEGSCYT